jgi:AhpD family alkylhydroperoxidase
MNKDLRIEMESFHRELPGVMTAFRGLHEAVTAEGALSAKTKKLMMLAVSAALRCEPCLREQVRGALELGASREEILEAAGVAILIGGGPTAAYCSLYLMDELNKRGSEGGKNEV